MSGVPDGVPEGEDVPELKVGGGPERMFTGLDGEDMSGRGKEQESKVTDVA